MLEQKTRRVAVTGLGVVTPNGIGSTSFWQAISTGQNGITHLHSNEYTTPDSINVAGIIRNFLVEDHIDRKLANRSDRMTHFALTAMQEALIDSRLDFTREDPQRMGAVIANTMGGVNYVLQQLQALYTRGPRYMSVFTAIAWLHVANVGQAAIRYGLQGYCKTPVNNTVGGLDALGIASAAIRRGAADVIITGGCEAFFNPFILLILSQQGQFVTGNDPCAYRPFDRRATGLILAEGAGICILEEYEHARQRGADIYGEIIGYGQTNDAHGLVSPSADGTQYARALRQAMQEGQVNPHEIAYISLDGHACLSSDSGEIHGLQLALGAQAANIPMSVPRTTIGHSYAAAGSIDAIAALLALKHHLIPPTINCEELNPRYEIDLVRDKAHPLPDNTGKNVVLLGGRGIGGMNVVIALRKEQ